MRTPALTALVASGALVVTVSAVVTAFVVDDDDPRPATAATPTSAPTASPGPTVSVTPSVTMMTVPTAAPTSVPTPVPTSAPPTTAPAPAATPRTVRYVVKGGDTLSDIAYWFQLNGFSSLYAANRDVIGSDPDRIRPGQVYTISNGRLRMS